MYKKPLDIFLWDKVRYKYIISPKSEFIFSDLVDRIDGLHNLFDHIDTDQGKTYKII